MRFAAFAAICGFVFGCSPSLDLPQGVGFGAGYKFDPDYVPRTYDAY